MGSATLGFELATGDGQAGQLGNSSILGGINANQVTIVFSKPVTVAGGSLGLEDSSSNGGVASGITVLPAAGNSGTTTVTWSLSGPLTSNKYYLELAAGGVTDAAGTALAGEWTTGVSTYAAGSGNGLAGGNFNFKFYLLAGDAQGNGVVSGVDFNLLAATRDAGDSAANWRYDLNGDGQVKGSDANASRGQPGVSLTQIHEPAVPSSGSSDLVPGGGELGNTSSAMGTAASPAATADVVAAAASSVVAAAAPAVAIATPAAAVQDSSATPGNTVAAAATVFESTRAATKMESRRGQLGMPGKSEYPRDRREYLDRSRASSGGGCSTHCTGACAVQCRGSVAVCGQLRDDTAGPACHDNQLGVAGLGGNLAPGGTRFPGRAGRSRRRFRCLQRLVAGRGNE